MVNWFNTLNQEVYLNLSQGICQTKVRQNPHDANLSSALVYVHVLISIEVESQIKKNMKKSVDNDNNLHPFQNLFSKFKTCY